MQQSFIYVSPVEGKLVTRFPSLMSSQAQYVGATRQGKKIVWTPGAVVAIPETEWRKYRREYRRAVADGALKLRTEKDFEAWTAERDKQSKVVAEKLEQESERAKEAIESAETESTDETDPDLEPESESDVEES